MTGMPDSVRVGLHPESFGLSRRVKGIRARRGLGAAAAPAPGACAPSRPPAAAHPRWLRLLKLRQTPAGAPRHTSTGVPVPSARSGVLPPGSPRVLG